MKHRTAGVCMVKDEADIIGYTLMHMAGQVDELIVADNGSSDDTGRILADLARHLPLSIVEDPDPAYYQSRKMTELAALAAAGGATWIVPFDADELWFSPLGRISDVLADLWPVPIARASLYNHFCTALDAPGPVPFISTRWRQIAPAPLDKVAFRWEPGAVIHQGNHGVTLPGCMDSVLALQVRHFPYRSPEQFVRKAVNGAAAYRLTDLPEDQGAHWRQYGALVDTQGPDALADVFRRHFWFLQPAIAGMVDDPAPYQPTIAP